VELNRLGILVLLGCVATEQGHLAGAKTWLVQALVMAQHSFGRARLMLPLEGLAQVAAAAGQHSRALRLAGAAAALRDSYAASPTQSEHTLLERWLVRARAALGQHAAEDAWAAGRQLAPEQAIAEALAVDVGSTPRRSVDPLTSREREVAILVANGADTRAIAEQLVISRNTARVHIERILSKLGLHSRAQLAAWAVQRAGAAAVVD
jgi:non-specific serine/threonine protein kinase